MVAARSLALTRSHARSVPAVTAGWCVGGRVLMPDGTLDSGSVAIDGGRISSAAHGSIPVGAASDPAWTIVPGFVDIHVHGGGGHTMTAGDPDAVEAAAAFHRRHGTTTTLASFVTAPVDELAAGVSRLAAWLAGADPAVRRWIVGVHLEGPFLSAARCGAQNPTHMVDPTPVDVRRLLDAGRGEIRVVTIAPERAGALDAIRQLVAAGVVAAIGHTDASFEQTVAAVTAGATLATHLGNAMSPLHHREPGAVGGCLTSPSVVCELIVDGHHLHQGMVRLVTEAKSDDSVALITDAISATGAGDGRYVLGSMEVEVASGVARLADGHSLAGSTLTMDAAFRNAIECGLSMGASSRAASLNPARVVGLADDVGSIESGKRANLVVLDEALSIVAVIQDGAVVEGAL
jgi:N-acetylglucosamine-6-phosphate deacetylase